MFSPGAQIAAKGGTALDVLKNVPSLSVDARGGVELRGSSQQEISSAGQRACRFFFDISKRRPVPIFNSFLEKWQFNEEVSIDHDISVKLQPVDILQPGIEFRIMKSDMDANRHVNNISYLHWLMEAVPQEITDNYFLHQIDGRFLAEAQYGDNIISLIEGGTVPHSFGHTIFTKSNNRVCATANTLWKPRLTA